MTTQQCRRSWTLWESSSQITPEDEDLAFHLIMARVVIYRPSHPERAWACLICRSSVKAQGLLDVLETAELHFFMIWRKLQDFLLCCEELLFLLILQSFWTMNTVLDKVLSRTHRLVNFYVLENYRVRQHFLTRSFLSSVNLASYLCDFDLLSVGAWCVNQASF